MVRLPIKMKKLYLILILLAILITSCSPVDKDILDGNSFDYYNTYTFDNKEFDVFLPNNTKDVLYYQYEVSKTTCNKILSK